MALTVPLRPVQRAARVAPPAMLAEPVQALQGLLVANGAAVQEITLVLLGQMGACSAM